MAVFIKKAVNSNNNQNETTYELVRVSVMGKTNGSIKRMGLSCADNSQPKLSAPAIELSIEA